MLAMSENLPSSSTSRRKTLQFYVYTMATLFCSSFESFGFVQFPGSKLLFQRFRMPVARLCVCVVSLRHRKDCQTGLFVCVWHAKKKKWAGDPSHSHGAYEIGSRSGSLRFCVAWLFYCCFCIVVLLLNPFTIPFVPYSSCTACCPQHSFWHPWSRNAERQRSSSSGSLRHKLAEGIPIPWPMEWGGCWHPTNMDSKSHLSCITVPDVESVWQ